LKVFCNALCNNILGMERYKAAKTILLYSPLTDEADVSPISNVAYGNGKTVLLPKVVVDDLELHIYKGVYTLERGAFGILEPTGEVFLDYNQIELAIVPGMAFDKAGHRLGRGKGYYDRLLTRLTQAHKIGVCFQFQYLDTVPSEAHDVCMDSIACGG
jgi:5-formyltetrahydrofolate cyclo-ligase